MNPSPRFTRLWPFLLSWFIGAAVASAQSTGSISGSVSDANTGALLVGAKITVAGMTLEAYTALDGTYSLSPVPAGTHEVVVGYLGYESKRESVTVAAGSRAVRNVALGGEVVRMAAFNVEGAAGAQARALNSQRAASNITDSVTPPVCLMPASTVAPLAPITGEIAALRSSISRVSSTATMAAER